MSTSKIQNTNRSNSICFEKILLKVLLTVVSLSGLRGHGFLLEPPSRGSLWSLGYPEQPPNYDVHGQNCGGVDRHYKVNGGRCGFCGDPYDGPREHEEPDGRFATGVIVREYQDGDQIEVGVELTWGHKGWMEFRLCRIEENDLGLSQSCLDQNLLTRVGTTQTRFDVTSFGQSSHINILLQLPRGLTCAQCVLQWKYRTGKDWGCDSVNGCCTGCGPQEEFYGCADVAIAPSIDRTTKPTTRPTTRLPSPTPSPTTTKATTDGITPSPPCPDKDRLIQTCFGRGKQRYYNAKWCRLNCIRQYCPESICSDPCQKLRALEDC